MDSGTSALLYRWIQTG